MPSFFTADSHENPETSPLLSALTALDESGRRAPDELPDTERAFPPVDELRLAALRAALRTGDTSLLPEELAVEVRRVRDTGYEEFRFQAHQVELDGALWTHQDDQPRPALVMPAPWLNDGWTVYTGIAARFQEWGYHVLAYTPRGFGDSKGEVEAASENDVKDAEEALNRLLERLSARVTKVGFLGDSYGSGISQLVAARDRRVAAVGALSTWGDMGEAFYENRTRHRSAVKALRSIPDTEQLHPDTRKAFDDLLNDGDVESALRWAADRSPSKFAEQLNERGVPMYFAHAWHETIFPANQTLAQFNALTVPKRLHLGIGDHSGPELLALSGVESNPILRDLRRWFDRYLKDERNGIDEEDRIVSEVMFSRTTQTYATWEEFNRPDERLYLGAPTLWRGRGPLATEESTGWSLPVEASNDKGTAVKVADAVIVTGLFERFVTPKRYLTNYFDFGSTRDSVAIWRTAPVGLSGLRLRGTPKLRVTYTPSTDRSTFIAYLFAVDPTGGGYIISHAPYTSLDGRAGQPVVAEPDFQATDFFVPAGWRVMLAIDSADAFYDNANEPGATLDFGSPAGHESYLDLPTG